MMNIERRPTNWDDWYLRRSASDNNPGTYVHEDSSARIGLKLTRTYTDEFGNVAEPSKYIAKLWVAADEDDIGGPLLTIDSEMARQELPAVRPLIEAYEAGEYDETIEKRRAAHADDG